MKKDTVAPSSVNEFLGKSRTNNKRPGGKSKYGKTRDTVLQTKFKQYFVDKNGIFDPGNAKAPDNREKEKNANRMFKGQVISGRD